MRLAKRDMLSHVQMQLALENNCQPGAFFRGENIITTPVCPEARRKFHTAPFFLKMVTMGGNAVLSADERLHPFLREFVKDKDGHWLFEHPHLRAIDAVLAPFGKQLFQTHHMFLPCEEAAPAACTYPVAWFEREELRPFYEKQPWPNALAPTFDNMMRPDILAAAAKDGDEIIALAGASADTELMWQIGIDVRPAYRGRGIGAYLVSLLRTEIEKRGKLPYYGTSLSNLASQRIALHCGFRPAWVETETIEW